MLGIYRIVDIVYVLDLGRQGIVIVPGPPLNNLVGVYDRVIVIRKIEYLGLVYDIVSLVEWFVPIDRVACVFMKSGDLHQRQVRIVVTVNVNQSDYHFL